MARLCLLKHKLRELDWWLTLRNIHIILLIIQAAGCYIHSDIKKKKKLRRVHLLVLINVQWYKCPCKRVRMHKLHLVRERKYDLSLKCPLWGDYWHVESTLNVVTSIIDVLGLFWKNSKRHLFNIRLSENLDWCIRYSPSIFPSQMSHTLVFAIQKA